MQRPWRAELGVARGCREASPARVCRLLSSQVGDRMWSSKVGPGPYVKQPGGGSYVKRTGGRPRGVSCPRSSPVAITAYAMSTPAITTWNAYTGMPILAFCIRCVFVAHAIRASPSWPRPAFGRKRDVDVLHAAGRGGPIELGGAPSGQASGETRLLGSFPYRHGSSAFAVGVLRDV